MASDDSHSLSTETVPEKAVLKEDYQKVLHLINHNESQSLIEDKGYVEMKFSSGKMKKLSFSFILSICPAIKKFQKEIPSKTANVISNRKKSWFR